MKTIALILCGVLVVTQIRAVPKDPPKDQELHVFAICLMGAAAVVGGVVIYMLKTCGPKYYCMEDEDGNRFPSNASRTERAANDWKIISGPYRSAEACAAACSTNTQQVVVNIPSVPIRIQRSTNLTDWETVETIMDDPEHFTWAATNSASAPAMFYRVQ